MLLTTTPIFQIQLFISTPKTVCNGNTQQLTQQAENVIAELKCKETKNKLRRTINTAPTSDVEALFDSTASDDETRSTIQRMFISLMCKMTYAMCHSHRKLRPTTPFATDVEQCVTDLFLRKPWPKIAKRQWQHPYPLRNLVRIINKNGIAEIAALAAGTKTLPGRRYDGTVIAQQMPDNYDAIHKSQEVNSQCVDFINNLCPSERETVDVLLDGHNCFEKLAVDDALQLIRSAGIADGKRKLQSLKRKFRND